MSHGWLRALVALILSVVLYIGWLKLLDAVSTMGEATYMSWSGTLLILTSPLMYGFIFFPMLTVTCYWILGLKGLRIKAR